MEQGVILAVMMLWMNPAVNGWSTSSCEDMECRKLEMCEEEKAMTQKVLNDRKVQCESTGGVACQNYERSMNKAATKRMRENLVKRFSVKAITR